MFALVCIFILVTLSIRVVAGESYTVTLPGSEHWDSGFDGQQAFNHVAVLASDSLRGRYSGFAGSEKSDAYIAKHFRELGLSAPFGEDGYRHNFTYGAGEYTMPSSLVFHFADGKPDTAYMWQDIDGIEWGDGKRQWLEIDQSPGKGRGGLHHGQRQRAENGDDHREVLSRGTTRGLDTFQRC